MIKRIALAAALFALVACSGPQEEKVADFSNDWTGNELVVSAIRDPKLPQAMCYFTSFDRSFLDRIGKGRWFENPSNSAISCILTGQVDEATLAKLPKSEEVFSRGASLLLKAIAVRRVVDLQNRALIYVSYSREVASASAKMDMSVIALPPAVAAKKP